MTSKHARELLAQGALQVVDRSPHVLNGWILQRLARIHDGKQDEVRTPSLHQQNLLHDECLGQARIALEHVSDPPRWIRRYHRAASRPTPAAGENAGSSSESIAWAA